MVVVKIQNMVDKQFEYDSVYDSLMTKKQSPSGGFRDFCKLFYAMKKF